MLDEIHIAGIYLLVDWASVITSIIFFILLCIIVCLDSWEIDKHLKSFYLFILVGVSIAIMSVLVTPISYIILEFLRVYLLAQLGLVAIFRKNIQASRALADNNMELYEVLKRSIRKIKISYVVLVLVGLYRAYRMYEILYK